MRLNYTSHAPQSSLHRKCYSDHIANNFSLNCFVARANYIARVCRSSFTRPCSWFSSGGFRLPFPDYATVSENGNGNGNVASALCNIYRPIFISLSFSLSSLSRTYSQTHTLAQNAHAGSCICTIRIARSSNTVNSGSSTHRCVHVRIEDYGQDSVRSTCVIFRPANSAFTLRIEELAKA